MMTPLGKRVARVLGVLVLIGLGLFGLRAGLGWIYQRGMNVGYEIGHGDGYNERIEDERREKIKARSDEDVGE